MESPELDNALAKVLKDWKSATREQRTVAHFFLFTWFKMAEMAWYQQQAGVLDQDQWSGWETVTRMFYHSEGVRHWWWAHRKNSYSKAFQDYLARTHGPAIVTPLDDLLS